MKKSILIASILAAMTGSALAATSATASTDRPCGNDTKCWREFALLERTQAQNAVGLYWLKVEARNKGVVSADSFRQCKGDDLECWKNLARVARTANSGVSALDKLDKGPEGR